jgi:hypothetical protein
MIQDFLEEHPNAEIVVTRLSDNEMELYVNDIRGDCGKPAFQAKDMYRVTVNDPDSDLRSVVWIDAQDNVVVCAIKYGTETEVNNPPGPGCLTHSLTKCFKGHVYWYDSCGEVEEKKEYCKNGCEDGLCKAKSNCISHHQSKCYEGHVYWYDSCGVKEYKKEYCQNGCENSECIKKVDACTDSDGGKVLEVKGTTKGININGVVEEQTDKCTDIGGQKLQEYYCENNLIQSEAFIECEHGCSDGACLSKGSVCYDSDPQNDIYTKGYSTIDEGKTKIYDQCGKDQGYANQKMLIQSYCDGPVLKLNYDYNCIHGCEKGSCIGKTCSSQGGTICEEFTLCQGDVLAANDTYRCCDGSCELPTSFDWRDRHGENWNSPVKDQGARGSCHTFGPLGAFESVINLYYNQHINIDLAEMTTVSCGIEIYNTTIDGSSYGCDSLYDSPICMAKNIGFPDEACFPYDGSSDEYVPPCSICSNYEERMWKIYDFGQLVTNFSMSFYTPELIEESNTELYTEEKFKQYLMRYGPVASFLWNIPHGVSIVGWEGKGDNLYLIYKNSWGEEFGDGGYNRTEDKSCIENLMPNGSIEKECSDEIYLIYIITPVIPPLIEDYEINCVDKDNDGFCNWGISENKPTKCPMFCKDERDWDDSDSNIGALGFEK